MKLNRWLSSFLLLGLCSVVAFAQQQERPIVVSSLIGDTLDAMERDSYQLFPSLDGFQWAVFYLNSDSSLAAKVTLLRDGVQGDTIIKRTYMLYTLRDYIPLREQAIKDSSQDKGSDNVLSLNNGKIIHGELLSVRDNAVVVEYGGITVIRSAEIWKVIVLGESKILKGIDYGLLVGGVIMTGGYILWRAKSGFESLGCGITVIGLATLALLTGTVSGIAFSTRDLEVVSPEAQDLSSLKRLARYLKGEPAFLRKIK